MILTVREQSCVLFCSCRMLSRTCTWVIGL